MRFRLFFGGVIKTFSPIVYIIVVSSIFYSFKLDFLVNKIWLVVAYYYLYRFLYNILLERFALLNKKLFLVQAIISILLSYFIYIKLIIYKNYLFPDVKTIGNELWIIIVLYLYKVLNNINISEEKTRRRMRRYIHNRYNVFKGKYHDIVDDIENQEVEALLYSISLGNNSPTLGSKPCVIMVG